MASKWLARLRTSHNSGPEALLRRVEEVGGSRWLFSMPQGARKMLAENPALFWAYALGGFGAVAPFVGYAFAKEDDAWYTLNPFPNNNLFGRLMDAERIILQNQV